MKDQFVGVRENIFGVNCRLNFLHGCLEEIGGRELSILDVGCGTGELLTIPLGAKGFRIMGTDVHQKSLERGRALVEELGIKTVRFTTASLEELSEQFDVVILSEVIEHVRPAAPLLQAIRRRLKPDGHLIITLPNGFGPFELDQLFWKRNFLYLPKLYERWKRKQLEASAGGGAATLNEDSPHVNWFTWGAIRRLLNENGYRIKRYRSRTFVTGNYIGILVGALERARLPMGWLARGNSAVARVLPPQVNSGWMLLCSVLPLDEGS